MRFATETLVLWQRNLLKQMRVPTLVFFALFQPLMFLILFSQVFSSLGDLPFFPTDSYLQFMVPAILAFTALNSAFSSGMQMVTDLEDGMLDKFLIAPIRRLSILAGRILADGTRMVAQVLVIVGTGYLMGARYTTGVAGIVVMALLAALFGMAWAGLSNMMALRTGNAEVTMVAGIVITFPVMFLSTSFMPAELLPAWLSTVAVWNPITYVIEAERVLTNGGWDWSVVGWSVAVSAGLAVATLSGAVAAFRKATGG